MVGRILRIPLIPRTPTNKSARRPSDVGSHIRGIKKACRWSGLLRSRWDDLPWSIKSRIFKFTDPLTQYLNHPHPSLCEEVCNSIWVSAFENDWDGDLSWLPQQGFPTVLTGLTKVKSRTMYNKLCELRPDLCYDPQLYASLTWALEREVCKFNYLIDEAGMCLINVALHHGWADELVGIPEVFRAILACYFGHTQIIEWYLPTLEQMLPMFFYPVIEDEYVDDESPYAIDRHQQLPAHYLISNRRYDDAELLLSQDGFIEPVWKRMDSSILVEAFEEGLVCQHNFFKSLDPRILLTEYADLDMLITIRNYDPYYLQKNYRKLNFSECELEDIKNLIEADFRMRPSFMWIDQVASNSDLAILVYCHNRCKTATSKAMDNAASMGYLAHVRFLHEYRTEGCTILALDEACRQGHLDVVQFLCQKRTEGYSLPTLLNAFQDSQLDILKLLLDYLPAFASDAMSTAFASLEIDKPLNLQCCELLLAVYPSLAPHFFQIGIKQSCRQIMATALSTPLMLNANTMFIKTALESPHLLCPRFVVDTFESFIKRHLFDYAWLLVICAVKLDLSLLGAARTAAMLDVLMKASFGRRRALVEYIMFHGQLDFQSRIYNQGIEYLASSV
ncbi:hypothetical protein HDV05_002454 [Chytridiales sp. JEL 0842]|nr:hypothetical protein HDV05_002454 [Chytridiales sp. JEL 0842]